MSGKSTPKKNITRPPERANSYFRFIFSKGQLLDWGLVTLSVIIGCLLVTRTYPYPGTTSDSFSYVFSAQTAMFTHFRPYGYSFFLRLVHLFSDSIYSVIVSQALIYIVSLGLLLLAVKKYWPPRKEWTFKVFEAVVALSPAAIFMLDTILSDTLQCALVFVMVAMLIVMIKDESWVAMVIYLAALFASFNTRYSSIFFPIAFIPILAVKGKPLMRVVSVALTLAVIVLYHEQRTRNMYDLVLQRQFSTGFEGWQLANNGIHVIPFLMDLDDPKEPPEGPVRDLHRFVIGYERTYDFIAKRTDDGTDASAYFIWDNESPLKQYLFRQMGDDNYALSWIRLGSGVLRDYGKWLILNYPGLFIKHYLLPNSKQVFFTTKLETICNYENIPAGKKELVDWFDIPKNQEFTPRGDAFGKVFRPILPWIELLTWIALIGSIVFIFMDKKWKSVPRDSKVILWLLFLFGVVYYGSTTFASPAALRYWMPMHAVKLVFVWIAVTESLRIRASQALR